LMIVTEPPLQLSALYIASPTPRESINLTKFFKRNIFRVYKSRSSDMGYVRKAECWIAEGSFIL
jgi:hypothetical protein